MNTKHTPGPWKMETGFRGPMGGPQEAPYISVITDEPESQLVIADCPHYSGNNGLANAALIAAAPDLLAALHHIRDVIDAGELRLTWSDGTEGNIDAAREVIARAEGND